MKIIVVYPGPTMSTYDVARGWERAFERLGHQVRAFNYHNMLTFYRDSLIHWKNIAPAFEYNDDDILQMASERLIVNCLEFEPDLVWIVAGTALYPRTYLLLEKLKIPTALLLTECPYWDEQQIKLAPHAAWVFVNDTESLADFQAVNPQTFYMGHSYDPTVHHPYEKNGYYSCDVFFCGTGFPERRELFGSIDWDGIEFRLFGSTWDIGINHPLFLYHREGTLDNEAVARWYSNSAISVNAHRVSMMDDFLAGIPAKKAGPIDAWSIGPRAYEITACGAFQLCDDSRGELAEVFGDTVATYRWGDPDDLKDKIAYYLVHEVEREDMARAARERVTSYTFENRATEALSLMGV